METSLDLADRYRDFAGYARGDSPCFAAWAEQVAEDPVVLAWLEPLPRAKQQPNLVFAAARWHGAPAPGPYDGLRDLLLADDGRVRATILERSTQTNEAGRLATLTPVLAEIPGPLALIEVGASAGLCLHPDGFDYAWPPRGHLAGSGGPILTAIAEGALPVPRRHPQVAWRGGVDLNPLDVHSADDVAWLTTLVWPEHDDRREQLTAAVAVARDRPAQIVRGDLLTALGPLVDRAAVHGTVVVYHSAVIAYLDPEERAAFVTRVRDLRARGVRWLSNEAPGVVPGITSPEPAPPGMFALAVDGRQVAWAHQHGRSIRWL